MKWTVVYLPASENELATLWLDAESRVEVADAANHIDRLLASNPEQVGESREPPELRILFVTPLAVLYRVKPDDRLVEVVHIWRFA